MIGVVTRVKLSGDHVTILDREDNKKRYDSELPYQRPDLIDHEVMEIEIDLTTSTIFYKSVRECLDC